jgi:hypothetical protein
MRRRRLLVLGGVLAVPSLTGCLRGSGSTLSLEPVDPTAHYALSVDELDTRERTAVEATVDGGNYTIRGSGRRPFHPVDYVERGGVYYRVETEETEPRSTMTRHILRAESVNSTTERSEAVSPDAYDPEDRETVVIAYRLSQAERAERDHSVIRLAENRTNLLPEPEHPYVIAGENVYRLTVEERELEETGYAVTSERVADNDTAFLRHLDAEKIATVLDDDLTQKQREVLNTAIEEDRYTAPSDGSEPRSKLVDIFQRRGEFDVPSNYDGVVKYNGEYYGWDSYYPHD